ncbi:PREDICTED: uncharacterized protein LOC105625453, partial [Atta cephalotes]|uniref:Uncharacterized protein n=1 Tax=Atta cephalotes TaxID=12957 RepID=A0A158NXB4_ATTCE
IYKNGFHIWYVNATDPWNRVMYDVIVNQIKENHLAKKALRAFQIVSLSTLPNSIIMKSNSLYTNIISKQENSEKNTKHKERIFNKNKKPLMTSLNGTVDNTDINEPSINTIIEKVLKPRWILQPNEIQKFKIRYQPEEVGIHRQTYALSILDGNEITYDINVSVIADVPKLDMNPNTIFSKELHLQKILKVQSFVNFTMTQCVQRTNKNVQEEKNVSYMIQINVIIAMYCGH